MPETAGGSLNSFDFLQSVVHTVPYGLLALDTNGRIVMINKLAREWLAIDREAGRLKSKELHPLLDHFPSLQEKLLRAMATGKRHFGFRAAPLNDRFLDIKARSLQSGMLIVIGNVTGIKHMEAELLHAMMEGQETERRRLAKELHDGIGPLLSAVKMHVEGIEAAIKHGEENVQPRLAQATELIDSVAEELRAVSHALMPRELLDFGLAEALLSLCNKLQRSKRITIEFIASGDVHDLDNQLALAIYRCAQELINNAVRHGGATVIGIQLIRHVQSLVLMVEDNGCGMDQEAARAAQQGTGLLNIESRVTALGGAFIVDSTVGNADKQQPSGTIATIEVPLTDLMEDA